VLKLLDSRLEQTTWFAGDESITADIMSVFSMTTMRTFMPFDLSQVSIYIEIYQEGGWEEGVKGRHGKGRSGLHIDIGWISAWTFPAVKSSIELAELGESTN
jgi:glutathione S-transferase